MYRYSEFAKYGCTERGSKHELDAHCEEDAPRHLRLVMLAVEGVTATFKAWYGEVGPYKFNAVYPALERRPPGFNPPCAMK